ncbi:iqgap- protein [Massospora cicadina]|nr:iqgap- protein [Massospora cicadina]
MSAGGSKLPYEVVVPDSSEVTGLHGRHRLQRSKETPRNARYLRTGSWVEKERHNLQAYEYLCHIGEVDRGCNREEIAPTTSLDEDLRNGIVLAKLVRRFHPECVKKIFEGEKLQYRHSDNINYVFAALNKIGLPDNFNHLLYKRGLAPSISNLVGYLQFTDEQIVSTQKQLDDAGVALPAFKKVRSQLAREMNEPLPMSVTEPDMATQVNNIQAVQGLIRGFITRRSWLQRDEAVEPIVIRAQSQCRGCLARRRLKEKRNRLRDANRSILQLQAQCKAVVARLHYRGLTRQAQQKSASFVKVQGLCQGALARRKFAALREALATQDTQSLQAACRAFLVRRKMLSTRQVLEGTRPSVVNLQSVGRSVLSRRKFQATQRSALQAAPAVETLQANIRRYLVRNHATAIRKALASTVSLTQTQALAKAALVRRRMAESRKALSQHASQVVLIQASSRGLLARERLGNKVARLQEHEQAIRQLQALICRSLVRKSWEGRVQNLLQFSSQLAEMQALARGLLVRSRWTRLLAALNEHFPKITHLQAIARGYLSRRTASARMEHYQEHEATVVKIQSAFRAKLAKRAYYEMSMKDDPPVAAMRNFLYLLDDSEADFTAELELEKLRQKVVRTIRENKTTEAELNDLDIKIALLVKNRITLDEVVRSSKGMLQSKRNSSINPDGTLASGSSSSTHLASVSGAFSLKSLDRESRNRLRNYQLLFYMLQTQPAYLARLLVFNKAQMGDRVKKFIETVVLTLFNFAQNRREEYLLLRLFKRAIQEEINSVSKIEEFLRGNPVFIQLAVHYNRGAKERKYLRDLLQPLLRPILENRDLDLETDPVCIYRGVIREEESRTGTKSKRKYNVTKQSALNDPETKAAFIKHLQQLRSITSDVIDAILASLDAMPYGVRYIAKELKLALTRKFPDERPSTIIKVVGHLVYYRYINPAITAPELFDVIETVINSVQRKNLAEIAKMLNQVSMGKLFTDENIFLQPLNNFIGFTAEKFARYFQAVTEVEDPHVHFEIDEFSDQVNLRKPTIYISYNEIISLHRLLYDNEDLISPDLEDPIRPILLRLGPPPQLMNFEERSLGKEIALVLSDPAAPASAQREEAQQIFLESKRQVLYAIKVHSGATLLDILTKPVAAEDERRYARILDEELERSCRPLPPPPSPALSEVASIAEDPESLTSDFLSNLRRLTLGQLKAHLLKNMEQLEAAQLVSKRDGYQAMVNAIARDIKNKHQRREQRTEEFRRVRQTLVNLDQASRYYAEQKASYNSYISACMANLRAGRTKGRHRARPFSKQYFHAKGLERAGKMPKFGSYKYGADDLFRRGILVSVAKFNPSEFGKMSLTISSDEMGVFRVEATLLGIRVPNANVELRFDELLQAQFDNAHTLSLFDDTVKVNVNLLLYLINKKFYT